MNIQFKKDVQKGLTSTPKFLSSKYFYDEIGDDLFVKIMNMPEYYLTNSELEIFQNKGLEIIDSLKLNPKIPFQIIELGAGDGTKTKLLLNELLIGGYNFEYVPIDISQHALDELTKRLTIELPQLRIQSMQGDYFDILESIQQSKKPKVVLFLGSNIGNLQDDDAHFFLGKLGSNLSSSDKLLLGVDLIKSEEIVLPAYNDASKITAQFNLNLLERINRELGGCFNLDHFEHKPKYDEKEGIARSFLESTIDHSVKIEAIDKEIQFKKGEKIHTEISRKYNNQILMKILANTNFEIIDKITDRKNYFANYVLDVKKS